MRLDLFLKKSRIIKRRSQSKILIDSNLVYLNDKIAKPSSSIKIDDIIVITMYSKKVTYKVISLEKEPFYTITNTELR